MGWNKSRYNFKCDSTEKSDRYLAYLEQFGPDRGVSEIARMAGCSRNAIYMWRKGLPHFKRREDEIVTKWQDKDFAQAKATTTVGLDLVEGLDTLEAQFIDLYRKTHDRAGSCSQIGVTWVFMRERIKSNPHLKAAYEAVLEGLVAANEDTVLRRGATGDVSAAKVTLKAHLPERYGDRVVVDQHTSVDVRITGDETIRELNGWIKRFGRLQPAGEFRREQLLDDGEVIDAEAVAVS